MSDTKSQKTAAQDGKLGSKRPGMMGRISNLRRGGRKKDLKGVERTSYKKKGKGSKPGSTKFKQPRAVEDSERLQPNDEELQKKIKESENVKKFMGRYEKIEKKKQRQKGKFRFLKQKKRKVGRDIYKRAYDHEKLHKIGYLSKRGGKVKNWKKRYFVLKKKMLFYFESLEAFERGDPPKGWIWLKDMYPNKKNYVCTPTAQFVWMGKLHGFTIATNDRVFALCAKSKGERMKWMMAIRTAYEEFWSGYGLPIPVNKTTESEQETGTLEQLRPIAEKLDTYDELEQNEIEEKTRLLMLAQCLVRWQTFVQLNKLQKT